MKKIFFITIMCFLLLFGCTNPEDVLMEDQGVKNFFSENNGVELKEVIRLEEKDFEKEKKEWEDLCKKDILEGEYYKVVYGNDSKNLEVLADVSNLKVICRVEKLELTTPQNQIFPDVIIEINQSPTKCNDIDCFINASKNCQKAIWVNENKITYEIKGVKENKCVMYRSSMKDNCYYDINNLTKILENWKKKVYSEKDFESCENKIIQVDINIQPDCKENWVCGKWSECINGKQKRTCNEKNNCITTVNKPITKRDCNIQVSVCVERWECSSWSDCQIDGNQTRNCNKTIDCNSIDEPPATKQICNYVCPTNWVCSNWSNCNDGKMKRNCIDNNYCDTNTNKPIEEENCSTRDFDAEWILYEEFFTAINSKDINKLVEITYNGEYFSYYTENYCKDENCWELIKNFFNSLKLNKVDVKNVWKDDKQTILLTEIYQDDYGHSQIKVIFVKNNSNKYLLLSQLLVTRPNQEDLSDFDTDGKEDYDEDCVDYSTKIKINEPYCFTNNKYEKDTDGDGWWDGVEDYAGKSPTDDSSYLFN